jgi:hypothetical protein
VLAGDPLNRVSAYARRINPSVTLGHETNIISIITFLLKHIRGPFEEFVVWRQCAAVMQREAVIFMPNFSGGDNVVVA